MSAGLVAAATAAHADLPEWMQHVLGASTFEAAVYRAMDLPGLKVLYPRPPKEAQAELQKLTQGDAKAELYTLKARTDEQALDFAAAEADWKAYVAKAADATAARLQLADYYHRRLQTADEIRTLSEAAAGAAPAAERYTAPAQQRSWTTYERLVRLLEDQGPDRNPAALAEIYKQWIARYPRQTVLYARALRVQLERRDYAAAEALIAQYRQARADDAVFPIKATALVEYTRGSQEKALAVYDASFQPLWPDDLVQSYLSLLTQTHRLREFVADARARLAKNPDDLNALARIVVANRAQGQAAIDAWRAGKDARGSAWSVEELYTLARLCEAGQNVPEAARYDFALASAQGNLSTGEPAAQAGTAGLVHLLLSAPEQPIALGAGNLSMYRDIATLDRGPGYWNGVLSLWLNGATPDTSFHDEELKAQPYFHRTKAAELLAQFDRQYPQAAERAGLHAELLHVYAGYGETELTIAAAKEFLAAFPKVAERTEVAGLLADAYSVKNDTASEFALYDAMLAELGAQTAGMPLTAAAGPAEAQAPVVPAPDSEETKVAAPPAFELSGIAPEGLPVSLPAVEYRQTLERYIGRLTATGNLPKALAVLRAQLDRNPGDPLLYERLAAFLQQNNLYAQQEAVYKLAIDKFQDAGWYDKLARLYLREKRREAFAEITRQVVQTFDGTGVDRFFAQVDQGGPDLFLQLNLYASQRFPHDLTFTRNLLAAYSSKQTGDASSWQAFLRRHWMDAEDLRAEFFEDLSRRGALDAELAQLKELAPEKNPEANPAATRELAEIYLHGSHFEQSAPLLGALAAQYPADEEVGGRAASVYRSLAYYDPAATGRAVAVETRLLAANPGDTSLLATLGDLQAEQREGGVTDLAAAAPYWRKIPAVHAGSPDGYLEAATIFWDYFQFDDALAQIAAARTRFHQPALYGYEAGAIDEGRREMSAAIAEYTAAALASNEPAGDRLRVLARRKSTRELVDAATVAALAAHDTTAALSLRADVLLVQHRDAELPGIFDQAIAHATSTAQVEELASLAQSHALTPVYEHAVAREAELSTDGVAKIEAQYTLARSYESRRDVKAAGQVIDAVYRANPKLLGVVRATTDFYDRTGQPPRAIATLLEAAKSANPQLATQFTLEAADKANAAGDTAQGRTLAGGLLEREPYNPRYLAVMAASYARAGDDAGLKQFYTAKLDAIKAAPLSRDEKKQTAVVLRRGLIPALTRLKDYAGGLDQYIAILSAYPEDTGTTQEAALYALRYSRQPQLLGFLQTTVKASPQDSRFAILLAQVQTTFEDLPAAVAAYTQAITIRKDRADLYTARADLLVRLERLDEAAADYQRLYVLTYKDPSWMVKLAELRARQQRPAEAVKALETAWITGRPVAATNSFEVAAQLEQWNLLTEARTFAELGLSQAGNNLLLASSGSNGVTYARILARAGQADKALQTLLDRYQAADASPLSMAALTAEAEKEGVASVTDAEWRRNFAQARHTQLASQLRQSVDAIGGAVQSYFTPEQRLAYAQALDQLHAAPARGVDAQFWVETASSAGLRDREADWRKQLLLAATSNNHGLMNLQPYTQLQQGRLEFAALGQTLEALVPARNAQEKNGMRRSAADAYRSAGDADAELRLDRALVQNGDQGARERYFELLLQRSQNALTTTAGSKYGELADAAANYALEHGTPAAAQAAVAARAANLPALWRSATVSLLGLYYVDPAAASAYIASLGDKTIGERIGASSATAAQTQLTGKTWFYYAGRYGVYRTVIPAAGEAEDFLAAPLERNPESARSYANLARTYLEAGRLDAALAEYGHALELDADQPAVQDEVASALWRAGRREEAIAHWRQAYVALLAIENKAAPPESFWTQFDSITAGLGRRGVAAKLRPEIDAVLTPYLARNGSYRSNELLRAVYQASATPAAGMEWIYALASASKTPDAVREDLALYQPVPWLTPESTETLLLRLIELERSRPAGTGTDSRADDVASTQRTLLALYFAQNELAKARALLDTVSPDKEKTYDFDQSRIVLAARTGQLPALLDRWRAQPDAVPAQATLDGALRELQRTTPNYKPDAVVLRSFKEFLFARRQLENTLTATDFLSLADARLKTNDLPGALELLHRLALRPVDAGDAYANVDSAAALLESAKQPGAAIPFLTTLSANVPWNASYRSRLAVAQLAAGQDKAKAMATLLAVAAEPSAPYAVRVAAVKALPAAQTATLGSRELELLASSSHGAEAARQPYFAAARIAAAYDAANRGQTAALLREAIAIDPSAPDSARAHLRLFEAEAEAGHAEAALAVFASLENLPVPAQPTAGAEPAAGADGDESDVATDEPAAEASGKPWVAALPRIVDAEPVAARIHLAELLAKMDEAAHRPSIALGYLQAALQLETDATHKAALQHRYDTLRTTLQVDQRNAARRPTIHAALDQANLVRPRLTPADLARETADTPATKEAP